MGEPVRGDLDADGFVGGSERFGEGSSVGSFELGLVRPVDAQQRVWGKADELPGRSFGEKFGPHLAGAGGQMRRENCGDGLEVVCKQGAEGLAGGVGRQCVHGLGIRGLCLPGRASVVVGALFF